MADGAAARRLSWDVSGLEDPDELVERLEQSTATIKAMTEKNRELVARVRQLERRAAGAAALTTDEQLAELPKRMTDALASAEQVRAEVIEQARRREAEMRQRAEQEAARLVAHARGKAAAIVAGARQEATAQLEAARAQAVDIVGTADGLRRQVLAELREHYAALEERVQIFEAGRHSLLEAYELVERRLGEGKRALLPDVGPPPRALAQGIKALSQRAGPVPPAPPAALPAATNGVPATRGGGSSSPPR